MSRKFSRYEINQLVKTVLVRHAVDLSCLNFTCTEQSAYLSGDLKKDPRGEHTRQQILAMIREFEGLPVRLELIFDLNNWVITQRYGTWEIQQSKKTGTVRAPEEKPYVIKEADPMEELLQALIKAESGGSE